MTEKPFIPDEDRPDLTVDLESKVGDLTVRDLAAILGLDPLADVIKDHKERAKDTKDSKDKKDSKDQPDQKQQKDQKDVKDQKDQKDHKEEKDYKEQKDTKDHKDHKDHKERFVDLKAHSKDVIKDVHESKEFTAEKPFEIGPILEDIQSELDQLIKRVSGLEKSIEEMKGTKE